MQKKPDDVHAASIICLHESMQARFLFCKSRRKGVCYVWSEGSMCLYIVSSK